MCKQGTMTVVPTPDWLWSGRSIPENGIAIDSCMAERIVDAWTNGVRTLSSCCGHGKTAPSVVITGDAEQIELASKAFPDWDVFQWQLVTVNKAEKEREGQ